jgi:hypothetical protein
LYADEYYLALKEQNFGLINAQGQVIRMIKLEKPVEVLFEGVD